jgi:hypothetical protein
MVLAGAARRRIRQIERAAADPVATQEEILRRLVRRAAGTDWGREHGYADIATPRDYRERVPLRGYEEMRPWWERYFDGDHDVTWPGHTKYFALSSGTTSGNKLLPVSRQNIRSNRRSGLTVLSLYLRQNEDRGFLEGKTLYLAGSAPLRPKGQAWIGDASGIMFHFTPPFARRYQLPTSEICSMTDWPAKIRAIVDCSIEQDVRLVSACPSWVLVLFQEVIEEGRRRFGDRVRTVSDVWRNLGGVIHFGMAWTPYRPILDRLIGRRVVHMDTYSASEGGMFAVQEHTERPDLRLQIDNGIYYEFIPFDELDSADPTRLGLGEVEEGGVYELVLTTNSGIWAYRLGDLVRFTSTRPHRVLMVGRTRMNLNAFGEHVIVEEIEEAMVHACEELEAEFAEFTVRPVFPRDERSRPFHEWLVEFRDPPSDLDRFAAAVDRSIREHNEDYDSHRTGDYGLAPPRIRLLTEGSFHRWMEGRGQIGGQHKVPRVLPEPEMGEDLIRSSR